MTAAGRPLPKRTLERLAACESVGLHYWADHPLPKRVWAVDDHQRAHVVCIHHAAGTAQHVCPVMSFDDTDQCAITGEAVAYTVEGDDQPCQVHGIKRCTICIPETVSMSEAV